MFWKSKFYYRNIEIFGIENGGQCGWSSLVFSLHVFEYGGVEIDCTVHSRNAMGSLVLFLDAVTSVF